MGWFRVDFSAFDKVIALREDLLDDVFRVEHEKGEATAASCRRIVFDGTISDVAEAGKVFAQILLRRIPRETADE